jgi:hypothetical protein
MYKKNLIIYSHQQLVYYISQIIIFTINVKEIKCKVT